MICNTPALLRSLPLRPALFLPSTAATLPATLLLLLPAGAVATPTATPAAVATPAVIATPAAAAAALPAPTLPTALLLRPGLSLRQSETLPECFSFSQLPLPSLTFHPGLDKRTSPQKSISVEGIPGQACEFSGSWKPSHEGSACQGAVSLESLLLLLLLLVEQGLFLQQIARS